MVDRVEKIERIARVRAISEDNKRYNSGRDKRGSFAAELRRAMKKNEPATEVGAAYDLELLNCGTHSLFYSSGLSLRELIQIG